MTVGLQTKEQVVARHRAAALTARSEVIRMNLYQKIEQEGLSSTLYLLGSEAERLCHADETREWDYLRFSVRRRV